MEKEEINFTGIDSLPVGNESVELDIFGGGKYIKTPEVGQALEIEVLGIEEDKSPRRVTKEGKEFSTGFKDKTNNTISFDLITTDGRFNIKSAMLFYKIGGVLREYAKKHLGLKPSFLGAKIKIKHLYDGSHANMKINDLKKIKDFSTLEEAEKYQQEIKSAMKEFRIYEVELLN